jgi:hypothetical protein
MATLENGTAVQGTSGTVSAFLREAAEGVFIMNFWESFVVHTFLGLISSGAVIKNPAKLQELKAILLDIRDGINALYPGA